MERKKIISLILSAAIAVANFNFVFSAEIDGQYTETAEEIVLSGSAIETETIIQSDFANSVEYAVEGGNIYFDTDTGTITDADTSVTSADIPSSIGGVAVTAIGDAAFQECESLTKVIIPDGVTSIGDKAFEYCYYLNSITIPDSVTSIGILAFDECYYLSNITLPPNITTISWSAFHYCGIEEITIPDGVISIEAYAFTCCYDLKSVTIPDSVTSIGKYAFDSCVSLESVTIPDGVTAINEKTFSECLNLTEITIPDSVTSIGAYAFNCCENLPDITIPYGVTSIEKYTFCGCSSLKEITIPSSVTSINSYAFCDCKSLTNIIIPNGVTSIGSNAFSNCSSLTSITIPSSITRVWDIVESGLESCTSLETVYCYEGSTADNSSLYPSGVTIVYLEEESDYELIFDSETGTITGYTGTPVNITIPSEIDGVAVTSIGKRAFEYCDSLTSVAISDGVTNIGEYAFYSCDNLTSVYMHDSITSIGELAFSYCYGLTNISISNSVTSIGRYAFQMCYSLTELLIPDSVESIGDGAFHSCSGLTSMTIPSSVISIGDYVFACCYNLTNINVSEDNTVYTSVDGVVYDKDITELLYYPIGKTSTLTIPDTVTSIGTAAFFTCYKLTELIIPDGITNIGDRAFRSCEKLTSVTLPESVTYVGDYAFYYCPSLTSITILSKTITMGSFVFDTIDENGDIVDGTLETVYCYKGSDADDSSLYPNGVTIIYLDDGGDITTETTTVTTTETTSETTTATITQTTAVKTTESTTAESSSETTTEGEPVATPAFKVVGVFGGRSVTFTSETDGAVIYYSSSTSNITTDDIMVENGGTVTYEDYYGMIYARAYYNGVWSDVNKFVLKIPVVNTPTVTASGSTVTIKSTTPSSFILYTTDGTEPVVETDGMVTNGTWLRVNGARTNSGTVTANPGDTVRAVAVRSCFTTSASAAAYVSVSPAAFKVVGTFGGRNVTFTSDTSGAKIYYSSTTSSLTTNDKCVSNGETVLFEDFYGTIYARAYYNGKWSNVSRLILKIPTINTPTITYSGGKATIRTTTPNCYIYYTTDGSTPSITNGKKLCSNSYGQVSVSSGTTVKAIAVRSCFTNSEVVSYTVS